MMTINEFVSDKRNIAILLLFALFGAGIIIYSKYVGILLLFAFLVFGIISTWSKGKTTRFLVLFLLLILSLENIFVNGVKFGIDFSGGTRLPIVLEKAVDENTMNEILQMIKNRASVLGLTQVKVRAVGNSQIDVEVPGTDEELIKTIEDVLSHQGVFQGIIEGKTAISGTDILPGTIYSVPSTSLRDADWGVAFSVTKAGANNFAKIAKGQANKPLYMFLDRPKNSSIFISISDLKSGNILLDKEAIEIANKSLLLENENIELFIIDDFDFNSTNVSGNRTKAIVSKNLDNLTKSKIKSLGFNLSEVENISPVFRIGAIEHSSIIERWEVIGLLSAPILSSGVTEGLPSYSYSISGSVSGSEYALAQKEMRKITSILKGGSLPVQISLGSRTSIPAPLGEQFLKLSLFGVVAAILAISIFVSLRYMQLKIIVPILAVSISELIILISLLGSFTIDLAAMAGILAAIGVGVDAQIVITDELMKKEGKNNDEKLKYAFNIITVNVIVAVVVMLPLLFSGMVEIIAFALSTIIGSLLGFMLSRPVYALLVEKIIV